MLHLPVPSPPRPRTIVERIGWWVLPHSADEAREWLFEHPPAGSRLRGVGEFLSSDPGSREALTVDVSWPAVRGRLERRGLQFAIVDRPQGGAVMRVNAVVEWTVPRPVSEQIPKGASFLEVEASERGGADRRLYTIRKANRVQVIAGIINHLPARQPRQVICPKSRVSAPMVRLRFRRGSGGGVLATAEQQQPLGFCRPFELRSRGHLGLPLSDGERVIGALQRILSVRLQPPSLWRMHRSEYRAARWLS